MTAAPTIPVIDVAALPEFKRRVEVEPGGFFEMLTGCKLDVLQIIGGESGSTGRWLDTVKVVELGAQLVGAYSLAWVASTQANDDIAQFAHIARKSVVQPE